MFTSLCFISIFSKMFEKLSSIWDIFIVSLEQMFVKIDYSLCIVLIKEYYNIIIAYFLSYCNTNIHFSTKYWRAFMHFEMITPVIYPIKKARRSAAELSVPIKSARLKEIIIFFGSM